MAMCCICIDDGPIEGDKYAQSPSKNQTFQISMGDAPCASPGCFLVSFFLPPCSLFALRKKALGGSLEDNICCMGYYPKCGPINPGHCGEKEHPAFCLLVEVLCCCSCSISATRMMVMDRYYLHSDPCDRRIIRVNNCIQLLSCVCVVASIFIPPLRHTAQHINRAAEIVFALTLACMSTQVNFEIEYQKAQSGAPQVVTAEPVGESAPLIGH